MSTRARHPATREASDRERFLDLCEAHDRKRSYLRRSRDRHEVYLHGKYRLFATWIDDGPQPGAHLRSLEAGRKTRSTVFRGDHNWIYFPKATTEALQLAIAESRRITAMRGAGKTETSGLPDVYKPLLGALKVATAPPTGLHAGGPRAKVLGAEQKLATALCLRCMERVSHLTKPGDDKILAPLRALIGKGYIKYEILYPAANALPYGTESAKRAADDAESAAVQTARAVLGCGYGSQKCLPYVVKALIRTVREIEMSESPAAASAFLVELDELVMRHEFAAALIAKTKSEVPAFERVLWRGADAKGFPAWWVVRLDRTTYGVLGRFGSRWAWHPGTWDNTLALIPDAYFEAAVQVACVRDGRL